ncbi:MAG: methyltransferase domain-containing protein [Parvularcula sp.]|jgi:SAM-dependent methyltransferase|nr:methyltransferase domain-containing protein [Parvularcula sp.]
MTVDLNQELTTQARQRRNFALRHVPQDAPRVLEIGAFDNPTFSNALGDNVRYLDYFTRDELRAMHQDNPRRRLDKAVHVDFVVKGRNIADQIQSETNYRFDLIVANHVIEHVPDIIFWFRQLERLLNPQGRVFLAVPDRRYTFDYFRPETIATQIVRAHVEGIDKPSKWQLAESYYYHQKVNLAALWSGNRPRVFRPRFSLKEALRLAEERCATYTDTHCWVFTPPSFTRCMSDIASLGVTKLGITAIEGPAPSTNEFWTILSPPQAAVAGGG